MTGELKQLAMLEFVGDVNESFFSLFKIDGPWTMDHGRLVLVKE